MANKQHISKQYNQDLESVKNKVLNMGGLVELQVKSAIHALIEKDEELAKKVAQSDYKVNKFEVEIDEDCAQLIAKRQPAAGDLRLIIAIIKVITDLERIGDEAEKIGRYAQKLALKKVKTGMHAELSSLGDKVISILHDALDTFARMDADQAMKVVTADQQIDEEFDRVSRLLITHMMEDPRNIKNMLHVTWCARALERIGDHAQNICEYVIYLVDGKDVRHIELETSE
ncbi:phosphate signaling complex protein PhoU [Candidatus Thioglobus sp.]|uniref:phosphate signaling complex protein PhoU n=1 Tax=Candidatus Thioglobus sp. TaxID=2026721 RepID=UPI003D0FF5C6